MLTNRVAPPVEWRITPGLTSYPEAVAAMESRVEAIVRREAPELVWLLEHPAIYTAGSANHERTDELPFPVFNSGRGGQITYHGPGQRVVYVLLDLRARVKDVRAFVAALEHWISAALAELGIEGERRADRVGVWVAHAPGQRGILQESKIAAIGVRIRQWVTFHGVAINVDPDLAAFAAITPCGIADRRFGVTSLADLGWRGGLPVLDNALQETFADWFGSRPMTSRSSDLA